jgi:hypothetical protein
MAFEPASLDSITDRRTVRMWTDVETGVMSGQLEFTFAGSAVTIDGNATDFDSAKCQSALSGLKSVTAIRCERESFDATEDTGKYLITLDAFPMKPFLSNTIYHNGNPPLDMFYCNVSQVKKSSGSYPRCRFEDVITTNIPGI